MNERIKREIDLLPHQPGCYIMHNSDDKVIYVGKAKDLYKRVSQYFLRSQNGKVFKMVSEVAYFETIITKTEKEALLLEINLIRKHYPRYNILLKDGQSYPYIALKKGDEPYLTIARNDKDKRYEYFGPFPNSSAAYEMINLCNKLYPLRKCKTLPQSACLYFHMGQCLGPCINNIEKEKYVKLRKEVVDFLNGKNKEVRANLVKKMKEFSDSLEFERANEMKNMIIAIDHVIARQTVQMKDHKNRDVIAYTIRDGYLALIIMMYRKGNLLGKELFVVEQFNNIEEQLSSMIVQFYETHKLPKEIIFSLNEIADLLQEALGVEVIVPKKGMRFELVQDALRNAINGLDEHFLTARLEDDKLALLEELGRLVNIKTPYHIELFDNSHLQGADSIGALVVFINGEKVKKMYRKFHIQHEEKRDDFASMEEIVYRRYKRLIDENKTLPDLIFVDGGMLQINAALKSLNKLQLDIPILGLFKNNKHQTAGLIDKDEIVYPIDNNSPLFYFLVRMQDEVHRYAITFHRNLHLKNYKNSILDDVPMLGKARKEAIQKAFPTINDLKQASIDELSQILPKNVAANLFAKIHSNDE